MGFQFTFQFPITANEMGTLMNILLFCNVSKFHAASEQQQELNEQNGLHTQINYSNETVYTP